MKYCLRYWLSLALCGLLAAAGSLPAAAQPAASPQQTLAKAIQALGQAEGKVADDPEGALQSAKEARLLFKTLQKELAAKLAQNKLTDAQLEQEELNLRIAEDHYKKGEIFQKTAMDKVARSQEMKAQGDSAGAQNLAGVAQIEGQLALQHFVRSEIFSLKNQQLIFESILQPKN